MALEYFGKDFQYCFYPLTTDGCNYELLPSAPDSVYLFDSFPTEDEAAAGTGAIQGPIVLWTDTDDARGKKISFDAIDEPASLDNGYSKKYFVAINTELQTGNTLPPVIKEITLQRLRAQESIIEVSISDILGIEPTLRLKCKCEGDLEKYIDASIKELKMMLISCDFSFSDLVNPGALNHSAALLSISKAFFGQSRDPRDIEYTNALRYKDEFNQSFKRVILEFDSDRDGQTDGKLKQKSGFMSLRVVR